VNDARVRLRTSAVEDDEVPIYFGAADLVVCAYDQIFTSGVVALAQSMGRAVLAPSIGCLPQQVPEGTGVLYDPGVERLEHAIERALARDLDALGRNALAFIDGRTWQVAAAATAAVYRLDARR
jgi:glycosyltransferase involved in cell wall biosynthesis